MDMLVKLSLVFFVCLLSFAIGTFVGKKFSDNQHKIAKYESGADATVAEETESHSGSDREIASVNPESENMKPTEVLSDSEVASLAAEFVSDGAETESHSAESEHGAQAEHGVKSDKNESTQHESPDDHASNSHEVKADASKHEVATAAKHDSHQTAEVKTAGHGENKTEKTVAAAHEEPMAIAHKVVESHDKQASRIPSSLATKVAASTTTGQYTVQVAAKKSEAEAKKYADELKAKGLAAFYVKADVKSEVWYRVSVGLFTTQKEAEVYKKELLSSNKTSSAIVQKVLNAH